MQTVLQKDLPAAFETDYLSIFPIYLVHFIGAQKSITTISCELFFSTHGVLVVAVGYPDISDLYTAAPLVKRIAKRARCSASHIL